MILALRTDSSEAELYVLDPMGKVTAQDSWEAGRQLANELLSRIELFLETHAIVFTDLTGIVVFTGTGSFTGLRIGTTVANALAYSLQIPITTAKGDHWLVAGAKGLINAKPGEFVVPEYASPPNIT